MPARDLVLTLLHTGKRGFIQSLEQQKRFENILTREMSSVLLIESIHFFRESQFGYSDHEYQNQKGRACILHPVFRICHQSLLFFFALLYLYEKISAHNELSFDNIITCRSSKATTRINLASNYVTRVHVQYL